MSDTAHKSTEEKKQYFDSEEVLQKKINILAEEILKSSHFIAFTGAGISTSSGVPDYRSGVDTVLPTGPGVWEKKALGIKDDGSKKLTTMEKALPSFTHMTLIALEEAGFLKSLISQNTDGLHFRSGFPP